jgi:C-terminal processing protease CtpA/Prc
MPHIIKQLDTPPVSKKQVIIDAEPAVIVHRNQLKSENELKTEVKKELEKRKKITEVTTDEEFKDLFEMVSQLITQRDFWELPNDTALQFVYGYVVQEMQTRGVALPKVEKKSKKNKEK